MSNAHKERFCQRARDTVLNVRPSYPNTSLCWNRSEGLTIFSPRAVFTVEDKNRQHIAKDPGATTQRDVTQGIVQGRKHSLYIVVRQNL